MTGPPTDRETFLRWKHDIDVEVRRRTGFRLRDYPDQPFRDHFAFGMTPAEVADQVIEEGI